MTETGISTVIVTAEKGAQLHLHDVRQFEISGTPATSATFHHVISMLVALAGILETARSQRDRHSQTLQFSALALRIVAVELGEVGAAEILEEGEDPFTLTIVTDITTPEIAH